MYKKFISPFLFLFDPEKIHHFTFYLLKILFKIPFSGLFIKSIYTVKNNSLERELFGLKFPNPVGMAAGFDKNATHISEFENFGFGFIEIGTVTPKPQIGNPKKRFSHCPSFCLLWNIPQKFLQQKYVIAFKGINQCKNKKAKVEGKSFIQSLVSFMKRTYSCSLRENIIRTLSIKYINSNM